jgi:hypothetical protein
VSVTGGGDATASNQTTMIGHLDGVEGLLTTIDADTASIDTKTPALGQALAAASVPVVLTAAQITTLTPPAAITGFATSAKQDTLLTELQLKADLTETQPVSLASVPSHAVTNAGTFVVQENGAALTALQLIDNLVLAEDAAHTTGGVGVMALGVRNDANAARSDTDGDYTPISTDSEGSVRVLGNRAHDDVDSGRPIKIGMKAYSPDGTTPGTAVAEGDRTDAKGDLDGRLFVNDEHPRWGSYHADGSSALTDATVAASPGAGFQTVITNICVSSGAATAMNMFLEEGSTKIFGPIYLEAVAGRGFCTPAGFKKHVTAATAVTITTSAAIAHSVDIQYITQAV